jgi:UDP-N-acetylglucosamine 2-epimerase (non-hydrolysing)
MLSRIISCLNNNVNHVLVHTGQNYDYELNEIFFKELEIQRPNYFLNAAGQTAAETIGKIIIAIDPLFEKEKPDALLILGDTNSCLVSIPAKRRKIPIFHMEAGNRCFDFRVPEEINRRLVDHISDINMPYSDIAREYLLRENIHPDTIIKTGSPMMEVLKYYKSVIDSSNILRKLNLKEKEYFVASFHREENVDSDNILKIFDVLNEIATLYQKPIVVSTHPRTSKKIKEGQIKID